MDEKYRHLIHPDATALLRPKTGLKDMFVELDPGGRGAPVKDGDTIPVENTSPDIDPDETLSAFDTDTRSYLQLLINGGGKGLKNRGNDLNKIFKALGPTQRDLNRVTSAIAERRVALKELIHRYGDLTNTLADKDREIRTLVTASDAVFQAFASQNNNISLAVSKLPPTLNQTTQTLIKANAYARLLRPTLNELRPPFRQLDTTNHEVLPFAREAFPIVRNKIRPFVRVARPYVNNLRPAAVNLARATPDFTKSFHELNRFFNMAAFNPGGAQGLNGSGESQQNIDRNEGFLYWISWVAMNTDSMFSTSDSTGPFRRALFGLSCDTIKNQLAEQPAAGPLLGLINAINDPVLCGNNNGGPSIIPPIPPIPPLPKSQQTGGKQTTPTSSSPAAGSGGGSSPTSRLPTARVPVGGKP